MIQKWHLLEDEARFYTEFLLEPEILFSFQFDSGQP